MKKIKIASALLAVVFVMASAFSPSTTVYFYKFNGPSLTQGEIQDYTNYDRATLSCTGSDDVCGVELPTNTGIGNDPVESEFDVFKTDLWTSQQQHAAQEPEIKMEN